MKYYLGLGANLGDCKANLRKALEMIEARGLGKVTAKSSLYLTEPVGGPDQPWYVNAAAIVESGLAPEEMLSGLKRIEAALGRERKQDQRNLPRPADLNILMADDIIEKGPELVLPHPRMGERRFVLEPLAEIAPGILHPTQKKTILAMLKGLSDRSQVKKLEDRF